ncbi:MAG: hypothetical protein ABEL04_10690 [Salinibacter sp.]|uniref:hypothetical protein n=1 Tax=Salinibacter sp. TaxID=2065818 RepID=UPI0035D4A42B
MQRSSRDPIRLVTMAVMGLAVGLSFFPPQATAQAGSETDSLGLKEALRKHRHPVRLAGETLQGEGGQMLRRRAAEATVTVLGESHGTREIPALLSALLGTLQARGELNYLALETSPWTTAHMADSLQKGPAAYNRLVRKYPEAIPFSNLRPERALIAGFFGRSEKPRPLWGLDQIFAFAGPLALGRLETLAPSPRARRCVSAAPKSEGVPHIRSPAKSGREGGLGCPSDQILRARLPERRQRASRR